MLINNKTQNKIPKEIQYLILFPPHSNTIPIRLSMLPMMLLILGIGNSFASFRKLFICLHFTVELFCIKETHFKTSYFHSLCLSLL
jgi:hypothetical protein